jgi:phenylacetate-CoA ligase
MAFSIKRKFYESLPLSVKQGLCLIPFAWWAGKAYRETYQRGRWFDHASREELLAYQEGQLSKVLQFAVDQVPAYEHLRRSVKRFKSFDALKDFPILDKDTVQAKLADYLPREFNKIPHYEVTTGGTSGNQLKLYLDDHSQSIEMAFSNRFRGRMGYTPRCRTATFRGVSFHNLEPGVFWQYNPIYSELQFSPFHMSEDNLLAYVKQFIRYRPEYLLGYPSAIDMLAEYVNRNGLSSQLPGVKAAFLCSEGCSAIQRHRIEEAFRTRVFSWYGQTERVVFAGECEKNSTYHHFPDYGILEIIDNGGHLCLREGERGELVGTGLNNFCMPLVRYRTGDYGTRLESRCECGRNWERFTDVEGHRKQDIVYGHKGSKISVAALNMHGPLFKRVVRYQYFQENAGVCVLNIMAAPDFTPRDRLVIERAYNDKVGDEIKFIVQTVPYIPLTARGKLQLLVSCYQRN